MRITTIGRRNVGAGLAELWRNAGHDVQELGRDGGDASDADVVLIAVPGPQIESAIAKVGGIAGKPAIDVTNPIDGRQGGFASNAHFVKSLTGGPVAKAFDTVFASQYRDIDGTTPRPSCLWSGDDDIRELVERLIGDAGLEPVRLGDLDSAAHQEDFAVRLVIPIWEQRGAFFYRVGSA